MTTPLERRLLAGAAHNPEAAAQAAGTLLATEGPPGNSAGPADGVDEAGRAGRLAFIIADRRLRKAARRAAERLIDAAGYAGVAILWAAVFRAVSALVGGAP